MVQTVQLSDRIQAISYTMASTTDNTSITLSDEAFALVLAIKELAAEVKDLKLALGRRS